MLELSAHGLKILWGEDGLSTSSVITVMFLGLRPLREVMEVGIRDLGAGMKPKESSVKPEMVDWACDQPRRLQCLAGAGLAYGIATLACAMLFWRGF